MKVSSGEAQQQLKAEEGACRKKDGAKPYSGSSDCNTMALMEGGGENEK